MVKYKSIKRQHTGANICNLYDWQKVNNSNVPQPEKLVRKTHYPREK